MPPQRKRPASIPLVKESNKSCRKSGPAPLVLSPRRLPNPITSQQDCSEYRFLRLRNNIKVLLVSTAQTTRADPAWTLKFSENMSNDLEGHEMPLPSNLPSYLPNYPSLQCGTGDGSKDACARMIGGVARPRCSISISINAGSFADPPDFQGLAHFVEHIVHHGTQRYPGEDSFSAFLNNHAGHHNAFTDKTVTNYHASLCSDKAAIREVCRRYASMLSEPLVERDSVRREIESVDNEYFMRKVGHGFRYNQLLNSATIPANLEHPLRQFSCGSKNTLMANDEDNKADLRLCAASNKFIQTHYYGANMAIVLQAPESLDFLQECVLDSFNDIRADTGYPEDAEDGSDILPYDMRLFNMFYTVKPSNMDGHMLHIVWALPPAVWKNYKNKTLKYIKCVLGHNAPGGLAHHLRSKGYLIALEIPAEGGMLKNDYATMILLQMSLTQKGRDEVQEVLLACHSYLKLHRTKGPQKEIFDQLNRADKLQLEKLEMGKTLEHFVVISLQMLVYDHEDIIVGEATPRGKYCRSKIQRCFDLMTPSRANYTMFTSDFVKTSFQLESILGTEYTTDPIRPNMRQLMNAVKPYNDFKVVSAPNRYLEATTASGSGDGDMVTSPEGGADDRVVFQCIPYACMKSEQVKFTLIVRFGLAPLVARVNQPSVDVMSFMLKSSVYSRIFPQVDFGFRAGILSFPGLNGLAFIGCGLYGREAIQSFLEFINALETFSNTASELSFNTAREAVMQFYFDVSANPCFMTRELSQRLKLPDYLTTIESYQALRSLTFDQFSTFIQRAQAEMFFQAQTCGKIRRADVSRLCMRLQNFRTSSIPRPRLVEIMSFSSAVKPIPVGEKGLRMRSLFTKEKMLLVANEYQLEPVDSTGAGSIASELIYKLLADRVLYQLRTVEQLGYLVAVMRSDLAHKGFVVVVYAHADKHSPCYIDSRIEAFLASFYETDLTVSKLSQFIAQTRMISISAETVRQHYRRYLMVGPTRAKISYQILPPQCDSTCLCDQGLRGSACRKSSWLPPSMQIGNENVDVALAQGLDTCGSSDYFITSIDDYHCDA